LTVGKYGGFFYFENLTDDELSDFATITFFSQDPDNSRFDRMYGWGVDRDFPTDTGVVHAALWFAGRIWDERWAAVMPRSLDGEPANDTPTNVSAAILSATDRTEFLAGQEHGDTLDARQRARWEWPDERILARLTDDLQRDLAAAEKKSIADDAPYDYFEDLSGTSLYRWRRPGSAGVPDETRFSGSSGWTATEAVGKYYWLGSGWLDELTEDAAREKFPEAFVVAAASAPRPDQEDRAEDE
jgi:hypothetical protein